ncbi:hypothetical protein BKA69DRAFT_1144625 [Paraphysoderma sedebokerense]|nr:hypothetical protein BKA69DRAFT_1144625 [Paraphysoderma sedebokerense]
MNLFAIVTLSALALSSVEAICAPDATSLNRTINGSYHFVNTCGYTRSHEEATRACQKQVKSVSKEFGNDTVATFDGLADFNQTRRFYRQNGTSVRFCRASWSATCQMCLKRTI